MAEVQVNFQFTLIFKKIKRKSIKLMKIQFIIIKTNKERKSLLEIRSSFLQQQKAIS